MNIGIIGSGNIGANAARLFAKACHSVALSNARGPQSLESLVREIGSNAKAAHVEEAIAFGDVILLAIPFRKRDQLPAGNLFRGKVVIDAMNPYTDKFEIQDLGDTTSSEEVAKQMPEARLVKAFNTMYFETLRKEGRASGDDDRLVLFVAGDDVEAKNIVSKLIEDIGFAPVDTGSLREGGRRQQPGSSIYNKPLTVEGASQLLAAAP